MYMDKMLSIGKVENGFVVEVPVPLKREAKAGGKDEPVSYDGGCEKSRTMSESIPPVSLL